MKYVLKLADLYYNYALNKYAFTYIPEAMKDEMMAFVNNLANRKQFKEKRKKYSEKIKVNVDDAPDTYKFNLIQHKIEDKNLIFYVKVFSQEEWEEYQAKYIATPFHRYQRQSNYINFEININLIINMDENGNVIDNVEDIYSRNDVENDIKHELKHFVQRLHELVVIELGSRKSDAIYSKPGYPAEWDTKHEYEDEKLYETKEGHDIAGNEFFPILLNDIDIFLKGEPKSKYELSMWLERNPHAILLRKHRPEMYKRYVKEFYKHVSDKLDTNPIKENIDKLQFDAAKWLQTNKQNVIDEIINLINEDTEIGLPYSTLSNLLKEFTQNIVNYYKITDTNMNNTILNCYLAQVNPEQSKLHFQLESEGEIICEFSYNM